MLSSECLGELRAAWLPNITNAGLNRLVELLEKGSPLLIHGCFTRALPMGCLATEVAATKARSPPARASGSIANCEEKGESLRLEKEAADCLSDLHVSHIFTNVLTCFPAFTPPATLP